MNELKLSVIIPSRNRAKLLKTTLASINKVKFDKKQYEVLVIDNGSTDNTREVCDTHLKAFVNFQYHYVEEPGLHVGRHVGLKNAKAEILVYADDDIEAFPTWLEGIWESFQLDGNSVLVGGNNLPKWEIEPPKWILDMWNKKYSEGKRMGYFSVLDFGKEKKYINPMFIWGCNFSVRKSVLLKAGGFHPDGVPDALLKYRGDGESYISQYIKEKGYKASFNPKASVYHFVPASRMTEDYFCYWTYRAAIGSSYTDTRRKHLSTKSKENKSFLLKLRSSLGFLKRQLYPRRKSQLDIKIERAFIEGYEFHQKALKEDPQLLQWVTREHYLDIENLPYVKKN